ncbi:single-stranded DNA-binding protein [Microbacterium foliorum]|uniref:single-stranded DNA-binding protein n=1 Tax=Microbacterium foliorum TaxID=104336 RepID=UPI001D81C614|nr:single-stranded DNA-binding protein [Microbacterium foliorum]CAH0154733.1 Single-stranded DNA-binding protein 1 [Microbacterium foliorum]CAH0208120.1 Single-stranded DNA-binding protein 1 [Microbacterium foliorum]
MHDTVTIVGNVATDPTQGRTSGGVPVTNFRLASTHRRFDEATQTWIDVGTNWYSVAAFRQLAENAKTSLRSGDSVIVTGRMKIRTWENNGKQGTSVDIDAEVIGHDLRWGTTAYRRSARSTSTPQGSRETGGSDQTLPDTAEGSVEREEQEIQTPWAMDDGGYLSSGVQPDATATDVQA